MIFSKAPEKREAFEEIVKEYPKTRKELNIPILKKDGARVSK